MNTKSDGTEYEIEPTEVEDKPQIGFLSPDIHGKSYYTRNNEEGEPVQIGIRDFFDPDLKEFDFKHRCFIRLAIIILHIKRLGWLTMPEICVILSSNPIYLTTAIIQNSW